MQVRGVAVDHMERVSRGGEEARQYVVWTANSLLFAYRLLASTKECNFWYMLRTHAIIIIQSAQDQFGATLFADMPTLFHLQQ